jgi:hypothetical protein
MALPLRTARGGSARRARKRGRLRPQRDRDRLQSPSQPPHGQHGGPEQGKAQQSACEIEEIGDHGMLHRIGWSGPRPSPRKGATPKATPARKGSVKRGDVAQWVAPPVALRPALLSPSPPHPRCHPCESRDPILHRAGRDLGPSFRWDDSRCVAPIPGVTALSAPYPSSSEVVPNTWPPAISGAGPRYIRAVSNPGTSPAARNAAMKSA